ncbi:hypothetical protein [Sphingobacterium pedocola]|uniref:DUF5723 domain-containing protein n=1 Tax=Sphingobacterium pedocola TaxID=2082722 RepID=A0ABR9T6D1_9SPHI|nr:hypothetical protein [Sphingobacterium pedocola]MBE8720878.1 hypothetical protein [Sphingobacterium pedocola]
MKTIYYLLFILLFNLVQTGFAQDLTTLREQKPFQFQGSLELRGMFYNASGIQNRMQPFTYLLSGSPTATFYGWTVPMSFAVSRENKSFQQPFNQYGMSPTYKWITLHVGHRSVNFSPYTLAGHTMLGGGFELKPGKLRVGFMYGRLNKATVIDTTSQSLVPYAFNRKGFAAKLGYGTNENYFDLSFLHAKDDSNSVADQLMPHSDKLFAAANSVLGYGGKIKLFRRFYFESDGAISLYTRDLNSPIQFEEIDDPALQKLSGLIDINGTTEWFLAFSAGVGYMAKNYGLKVAYRRIEPEFKSMGAYFFTNDVENITISPSFTLWAGKIRGTGSLGIEQDNVNLQKTSTTRRVIGNANVSADINTQFGIDAYFTNFSNNQRPNTLRFADSLKIVQTTNSLSLMPRYTILREEVTHMILGTVARSDMNDYNSYYGADAPSRDISTMQYLLNYNIGFPKKMLNMYASLNYSDLKSVDLKTSYAGGSVGASYAFLDKKLLTSANCNIMRGKNQGSHSLIINGSGNLSYTLNKIQTLRASFYWTKNNPGSAVVGGYPAFAESRGELAYQINFGLWKK